MSTILSAAQTAYEVSNSALQALNEPADEQPKKAGSLWQYWPFAAAGMTCLITAVSAVALSVLGNAALGVLLAIAAVASGVLTIYLWSFSNLKNLDGYIQVLSKNISTLSQTALRLSGVNKDLARTRAGLEADVKERASLLEQAKVEFSRDIQKLTAELQESQMHVAEMKKIFDSSHGVISEMTSKINDFVHLNQDLACTSETLSKQLITVQTLGQRLDTTVKALDTEDKELAALKDRATAMAKQLYSQFMQIGELLVGLRKERERLDADLHSYQVVDASLGNHTQQLSKVAENLSHTASETQGVLDQLKPFDGFAQFVKDKLAKKQGKTDQSS
jgi:DNA repair ATPase RecN